MAYESLIVGLIALIVGLIISLSYLRKRGFNTDSSHPKVEGDVKEFNRSSLVLYSPTSNYERAVIAILNTYLSSGKKVLLLTQAPRSGLYHDTFKKEIKNRDLGLVNITAENPLARPQMFKVALGKETEEVTKKDENDIVKSVSINNLEFLREIIEEMEEGSVLVFEALSALILSLGKERKNSVYKFFSTLVEEMSRGDRTLIAFLNKSAHEKEIVSAYEGFFINILHIENGSIRSIKGNDLVIPF